MPRLQQTDLVQGIWIQLSLDLSVVERTGYTVLDVLSDVGGLQGILISAISISLSILNHNYLSNYLVSKLYKHESGALKVSSTEGIKEFCIGKILPRKLVCCSKKRK